MMSADYMHRLKMEAESASRRNGVTPDLLLQAHKDGRLTPSFPFIGTRTWKRDWIEADLAKLLPDVSARERCDHLESNIFFVDSSGFGADDEGALTIKRFLAMAPAGFGYAVREVGQFQVCVCAFIPPTGMRVPGVNYDVAYVDHKARAQDALEAVLRG